MAKAYANVIIDISHEKVDKTFQYRIPEALKDQVSAGVQVRIPFGMGNHVRKGYVVEVTDQAEYDPLKMKEICGLVDGGVTAESRLIKLAWWMKEYYGSTMNQALKTVLPVKQQVKAREKRVIKCCLEEEELERAIAQAEQKNYKARARLLAVFRQRPEIPYETAVTGMKLSPATIKTMAEKQLINIVSETKYRNPVHAGKQESAQKMLNSEQQEIVDSFVRDYDSGIRKTSLIMGVTGSGKTEVYMELIRHVIGRGRQVIVLIPEIALTYQTVMRFYSRFGNRVSIINSRLSAGERYDQFERAKNGEIDIMIGPRSALFTPFENPGLIIIDEEHEGAYKSEVSPRYHAREVAVEIAEMCDAAVVLGSATPSLEAYVRAVRGEYRLYRLTRRAVENSYLPQVSVVDLRQELKEGNKSVFSRRLQMLIQDRLQKREQVILFINRRGYANFVSCRSCGEAIKCPHCDVTLTLHKNEQLVCHYCGYQIPLPNKCPSCGSPYIANFGVGTQKLEMMAAKMFPEARILRMDLDTTSKKGGHEEILARFAEGGADILIGTQMIVKGHDFPNVTLVGAIAADLSLYTSDYRAGERTFQLLTQAAGRAGRGEKEGNVVIQTYNPGHYSIQAAAKQDYEAFYEEEMAFRSLMKYPPACRLLTIQMSSGSEEELARAAETLAKWAGEEEKAENIQMTGPVEASVYKVNDIYRKILYLKHVNYDILIKIRDRLEQKMKEDVIFTQVMIQYDFS
ncbi:primosomal protein N' [Clostridium sp. MCC353]|uniref:replication restart helicase PriA n=1 Tax=Clostridium sp. MCC353 TaxID=2592646 RepID=UPI001C019E51|nr:primosomal protein N' [Clostridium sp. MCC353]MBT9779288.1 primosomal protein N' [Clostridium sp. MCC353]